jgi:DNA replication and repair protein RecF
MIFDLRLQHFRSYDDSSFEFSSSVNIIVGPNASGKTNLLEAILVLAQGSSYRVRDLDLISFEQTWARLDGHTARSSRTVKLLAGPPPSKTYEIDERKFSRLPLKQTLPIVLFEPNHLQLLTGSPEQRRNYLDDLLEQIEVGYASTRRQYKRALSQRNALLKRPASTDHLSGQLFPWNVRLGQLGASMARSRANLITQIDQRLNELYQTLAQSNTKLSIKYDTPFKLDHYESQLLKTLESRQALDQQRGFTSVGSHREDMVINLDDHLVSEAASRGETRTLILALKIIELGILEEAREQQPILLLDDVFSELDGARRQALTSYVKPYQTFITTTDADVVVDHFLSQATVIPTDRSITR